LDKGQANYVYGVMRLSEGDGLTLFNGRDGAWRATLGPGNKRGGAVVPDDQIEPQLEPPDLWLLFAPLKKARTDFTVEKAVELGVRRVLPVTTDFTNAERLRHDRQQAHAIEAAEQCGAVFVPEVAPLEKLSKVLDDWPEDRRLMFCDEGRAGIPAGLKDAQRGPWAVLIGPEGGFSEPERARLLSLPFVTPVSLGPRLLRAETAAVAALTLWQASLGDWR
jgi:16S rRNA (uracil1498-N3)-methyltransferase